MKVLVTGGAGFVGSHIVDALISEGHGVRVVDALHPAAHNGKPDYLNDAAEYIWGDLRDEDLVRGAVRGIDAVSHQASMVGLGRDLADLTDFVQHNDVATATLLRGLFLEGRSIPLTLASSMVVYGEGAYVCPEHGSIAVEQRSEMALKRGEFEAQCSLCAADLQPVPVTEDAHLEPRSVYAATKLHQEHLMQAFAAETISPLLRLRYHNVYGDRMPAGTPYAGVASIFRSALQRGDPPQIFEDGKQLRDFVHVTDVARANVLALSGERQSGACNIATGSPHSVMDMAEVLSAALQGSQDPQVTGSYRTGDVRHVFGSPEKAKMMLGFEATVTFEEGMAAFAHCVLRADTNIEGVS
jgi:dTDP-L-rhamnose 4-epimerase